MDFVAMKRRELQALCKRHGLAAGGTNADLVARLTATLSGSGGAAKEAVGVVVGKGCLKRLAGGASGVDSDKKVTFELEEDEEAEVGVTGRGRRRSQVMSLPAVAKTRGRGKAGDAPPAAKGNGGERRRTRSQAGGDSADESDSGEAAADAKTRGRGKAGEAPPAAKGNAGERRRTRSQADSADESDSGEAGADAPVRRTRRNAANLGAGDGAERIAGAVTRKNSAKVEQEEVDVGDAVGRKHQLKRKTRENDIEDVDVSGQVGVSRRSTRSSSLLLEADALLSPVEKKRGRRKAEDVKEKTYVEDQPTEALHSGRTLRSGVVVVAPVPPIVSESKKSRREVQQEEPAVEKVAVGISRRTTRSSAVAAPSTAPGVIAKKRGRKTDDVHLDGWPDKKMENKRQSSRLTTRSSIHHLASTGEEASVEQVAARSKGLPPRRSRQNPSEASATDVQIEVPGPVRRLTRKSVLPSSVEHETNGMHEDVEKKQTVTKPVGRSTRRSVALVILEKESKGLTKEAIPKDVEKKQTVTKPVGRSTRRSVAPVILEKESKGLTKEAIPEAHVKRPTRKSVVPALLEKRRKSIITEIIPEAHVKRSTWKPALPMVNSENTDHCVVVSGENLQSDISEELEKQPTVKQPVGRLTRKSAVPAMLEKDRKGVPDMLNNENSDRTEMQSDHVGHLEKQLVVKEHVRRSTGKSVVQAVIEEENKGLHEELKSEVSLRTPVCKSAVPDAVNKENKDHKESVRREELSVKTRSAHTSLQFALQKDESLRRTTRQSSKLVMSPSQTKPTASKGRPAKRRRTSSVHESMPDEEQNENHTNDVIEVATSTDLEIGELPSGVEESDLRDSELNSELEGMVVVESVTHHSGSSEFELEETVGATEKPPSNLPIPECKYEGVLSEEAVHSIENDAGRCSPNFDQSPTGLQFSQGIAERSAAHNAVQFPENSIEESDVHKVECRVETVVSSKSDSYQGSDENSVRVEESGGYTFSSQQINEQVSSSPKDLVASAQLDQSDDADHVVRDVITKDLICKEEEKNDFIPSPDINVPHEISPANEPAENASGSGAVFCISQSTPISDEVNSDSSRLESPDALDNRISSNTEAVQQDNKEECNLPNSVAHDIHASDMSEAAQVEVSKSGKMLAETSAFQDAQLNRKREGDEFEEHSFSCGKDESGKSNVPKLANEYFMDSCKEHELKLPHDPSAVKSPKASTTCQDEFVIGSGTLEKTAIISATPVCKPEYGLPDKAEPHSLKDAICSSSVKQSPFGLQSLFLQDGTLEKAALGSATPECRHECVLPDGAEPYPLKEICSSSVEQSSFGLQSLFSQDDALVQGTQEKAALGSVTPECKRECGLPYEAESHPLKNKRCSASVEQSPLGVQPLFSPESREEPSENVALAVHAKNGVNESKDIHVEYGVQKPPVPETVSDHDISVDFSAVSESEDCAYTSDQGLTKYCHEQEQMACQLDLLEAANCTKDFTNPEEVSCDEENKKLVHSTDISSPEKIDAKGPVKHASGLGDGLLSSSLIASTDDTHVHPSSDPYQFESTGFLDGLKGCSSTEALQQGLKEQCGKPKELPDNLPAPNSPDGQPAETLALPDKLPISDLEGGEFKECNLSSEDTTGIFGTGYVKTNLFQLHEDSHMDLIQGKEFPNNLHAPKSPEESTIGEDAETLALQDQQPNPEQCGKPKELPDDLPAPNSPDGQAAETSALPDKLPISDLEGGEFKECNLSSEDTTGIFGTGYVKTNLFQLYEDSHMDLIQGKELPDDLPAPKSPEQSTIGQDAGTSALLDQQPNPELEGSEVEERNFSSEDTSGTFGTEYVKINPFQLHKDSRNDPIQGEELPYDLPAPKSPEDSTIGQDVETLALADEQPNPELDAGETEERNSSSDDTSGVFGTGHVKTNQFQLHEDSHVDLVPGKEVPNDLPAPKSPEQSTICQDAETLALPDEPPKHELEAGELEEQDFSSNTSGIFDAAYVEDSLFQLHEYSPTDPIQGVEPPYYLTAPKSPKQSTIGQDANVVGSETSPVPDEKFDPELEGGEFKEHNHSCDEAASFIFSSGSVKNNTCPWDYKEEYNEHNEDQATAAMLSSNMTKPTLLEGSESGMALLSAAGTPALTDEQLNFKLEGNEERSLCFDADHRYIPDTGLMENSNLFSLCDDAHIETCYEHELPIGTPAAKSAVCPDGSASVSVGICQTSGRRRIEEISTKLLDFKISSMVKGSYIAMDSAKKKQGEIPSPISLLGYMENVPAANSDDPTELNTDLLVADDSSRRGTTDGF